MTGRLENPAERSQRFNRSSKVQRPHWKVSKRISDFEKVAITSKKCNHIGR